MTYRQLAALYSNIFAIIAKLKRQLKRDTAVDVEEITKGNLRERINNLISDDKVINKSNLNKDFC